MKIRAFRAWRPAEGKAEHVASLPYDVVNIEQAAALAAENPESFLHAIRAEIGLAEGSNPCSNAVYDRAKTNLRKFMDKGILIREEKPAVYLYSQRTDRHVQCGVVATCHIKDYENGKIKIHEKTRRVQEEDRIRYVEAQNANTGLVLLTYRDHDAIHTAVNTAKKSKPLYHFMAEDGVFHTVWKCANTAEFEAAFTKISTLYVADGHHRSASAVSVGARRRTANPHHTGDEPYNYFLAAIFPANALRILAYNRVIRFLPSTQHEFLRMLEQRFNVKPGSANPHGPGEICMYIQGAWHRLTPRRYLEPADPVAALDVSMLQCEILGPILGIEDPRESDQIDFISGIEGGKTLEEQVESGRASVAFSMYPTSMEQLFSVANAGLSMPPKSTWFEPKLRSGLLVNTLD